MKFITFLVLNITIYVAFIYVILLQGGEINTIQYQQEKILEKLDEVLDFEQTTYGNYAYEVNQIEAELDKVSETTSDLSEEVFRPY